MNFRKFIKNCIVCVLLSYLAIGSGFVGSLIYDEIKTANTTYVKTKARFLTVTVRAHEHPTIEGGGTGVIVKPGPNGLARVLTNSHVCDVISVFPPDEEYFKMSLRKSLLLPVKAKIVFYNNMSAKVTRILKHTDTPDLCLIEINKKWGDQEYATLAKDGPEFDKEYFAVGYPGMERQTLLKGDFQGKELSKFPGRMNPKRKQKFVELEKQFLDLQSEVTFLSFESILMIDTQDEEEVEKELEEIKKKIHKITKALKDLVIIGPRIKDVYSIHAHPGSSGSAVWNNRGEIVALIWGKNEFGDGAIAVPLSVIRKFYEPRLTW